SPGPGVLGSVGMAAAGGIAGGWVAGWVGWEPVLPALVLAAVGGVWLAAVDLRVHRLPARVVTALTGGVAVLLLVPAVAGHDQTVRLAGAAGGAAALWLLYQLITLLGGGLGAGDRRLAVLVGGVGGWQGVHGWAVAAVVPFAVSALVGGLTTLAGRRAWGVALPFGPAMLLGLLAAVAV
ncbi:MAG: prepilin peptidase, partial [Frankia sp.]